MKTWRKADGHNGTTNKPGMIPVEEFKPRTLAQKRCLAQWNAASFHTPVSRKEVKKKHNRKARYWLNRDLVRQELENC